MDIDAVIHYLHMNDFFSSGLGYPVHTSGLYCMYRKHLSLTTPSKTQMSIHFEQMDLNDMNLYEKYDDLFHVTAFMNDIQFHESKYETMSPQHMESLIRNILAQQHIPGIVNISFG